MELKAIPESKKNLLGDRTYFWNKMIWEEKEYLVEKKELYRKATEFLVNNSIHN